MRHQAWSDPSVEMPASWVRDQVRTIRTLAADIPTNSLARQMADRIGHRVEEQMIRLPTVWDLIGLATFSKEDLAQDSLRRPRQPGERSIHEKLGHFCIDWSRATQTDGVTRFFQDSETWEFAIALNGIIFVRACGQGDFGGFEKASQGRNPQEAIVYVNGYRIALDLHPRFRSARYVPGGR